MGYPADMKPPRKAERRNRQGLLPRCEYEKCRKEFEPNPRNRTHHKQRFWSSACRYQAWNLRNPRIPIELLRAGTLI